MELSFLYAIPRTPVLDGLFLAVSKIAGSYGQLWLIAGAALLIFKKTRKTGAAVFAAAAVIAFGRLYMFLHFPTDVLTGIVFGAALGIVSVKLCDLIEKRKSEDKKVL